LLKYGTIYEIEKGHMLRNHLRWLVPVFLMAIITPLTPWLDGAIEHYFYVGQPGLGGHFSENYFYKFFFDFAVFPAQIVAVIATFLLVIGFLSKKYKHWRSPALLLILTMVIGAGIIVHVLLKDQWGRPRPKQTVEFGGEQAFRPYYSPNFFDQPEPSKSFPCGHCTMGFYFFSLAIVGERLKNKTLIYISYFTAISLGSLLGLARMAQGGHYLSDVLWTALIMWLITLIFDWLLYHDEKVS
jgi:lipid A 4'-phosphatase